MRKRHARYGFDLCYFQNAQIRLPLVKAIQRIVVGAEILRQSLPADRLPEHMAYRLSIDNSTVDPKPDNAPRELVHNHENPVRAQGQGFKPKQVGTPQTVLRMSEERQPGLSGRIGFGTIIDGKNPPNHVFVDFDAECESYLLGNSATAPTPVTPFHLNDGVDEFFVWSFRPWSSPAFGRKQGMILPVNQHLMKAQQGGRLQNDRRSQNAARPHKK